MHLGSKNKLINSIRNILTEKKSSSNRIKKDAQNHLIIKAKIGWFVEENAQ